MSNTLDRMINEVKRVPGLKLENYIKIWNAISEQNHSNYSINTIRIAMAADDLLIARLKCIEELEKYSSSDYAYLAYRDRIAIYDLMIELNFDKSDRANMLKLIDFEPLTPLTLEDDEWRDSSFSRGMQCNKRCGRLIRDIETGNRPTVLDAIIIRRGEELCTGKIYVTDLNQYIMPKAYMKESQYMERVYIDVFETKEHSACTTSEYLKEHVGDKYDLIYRPVNGGN